MYLPLLKLRKKRENLLGGDINTSHIDENNELDSYKARLKLY